MNNQTRYFKINTRNSSTNATTIKFNIKDIDADQFLNNKALGLFQTNGIKSIMNANNCRKNCVKNLNDDNELCNHNLIDVPGYINFDSSSGVMHYLTL